MAKQTKPARNGGMRRAIRVAIGLVSMSAICAFGAQTYYADWNSGSDTNDGLSTTTAFKSFERLVEAVNVGGKGSTGILAEGEYLLGYAPTCTVESATFKGATRNRDRTIINGQGQWRCLYCTMSYATVANMTVRRGFLDHSGGWGNGYGNGAGLYLASPSVNQPGGIDNFAFVTNCVFDSCTNKCSGSALAVSGGAKVIDCVFTNCWTSTDGGSLAGDNGGGARGGTAFVTLPNANDAIFEKCVFVDNAAANGSGGISSGIYTPNGGYACTNYNGIVLKDCIFLRNKTSNYGGAVLAKVREATRCHFVSNYAAKGSGAFNGPEVFNNQGGSNVGSWLAYYTNLLVECTFVGNTSDDKGGAYSPGMYAWTCFSNCTFRGNSSKYYGTLYMGRRMMSVGGSAPTMLGYEMVDCMFEGNETLSDDGSYNSLMFTPMATPSVVRGCLFESNKSPSWASAVLLGSNSIVRNCMFVGNQTVGGTSGESRFGGAVFFNGRDGLVEDSLFVGNTNLTSTWGCGINAHNGNNAGRGLKVYNCTFVRNGFGVMYGVHGSPTSSDVMDGAATVNCLFWRNASDFKCPLSWYGCTNCYANANGFAAGENGNIKGSEPRFTDPEAGDWTLGTNSPCKNKGLNAEWMLNAKDLAGNPRIDRFLGIVDIGCYESLGKGMSIYIK